MTAPSPFASPQSAAAAHYVLRPGLQRLRVGGLLRGSGLVEGRCPGAARGTRDLGRSGKNPV